MEKTRVPKGDWYWFIFRTKGGGFVVNCKIEEGSSDDNARFDIGNYFIVKGEADSMARKLRAVFKGADVIEMPAKCEIVKMADEWEINTTYASADSGSFIEGIEWLKSKIIK